MWQKSCFCQKPKYIHPKYLSSLINSKMEKLTSTEEITKPSNQQGTVPMAGLYEKRRKLCQKLRRVSALKLAEKT